jgi:hypothetical protein
MVVVPFLNAPAESGDVAARPVREPDQRRAQMALRQLVESAADLVHGCRTGGIGYRRIYQGAGERSTRHIGRELPPQRIGQSGIPGIGWDLRLVG